MKIPVFLPVTREFGFRDEFAQDSLLQRRVRCELDGAGSAATSAVRAYAISRCIASACAQVNREPAGRRPVIELGLGDYGSAGAARRSPRAAE